MMSTWNVADCGNTHLHGKPPHIQIPLLVRNLTSGNEKRTYNMIINAQNTTNICKPYTNIFVGVCVVAIRNKRPNATVSCW